MQSKSCAFALLRHMTELTWEGKYDKSGKRAAPVRIALPFQTIETVNESAQDRQKTLDLFARGKPTEWRNRLIWGDKKYVLPSLLPEFAGKANLIYIDPPFDTGADFSFIVRIPPSIPPQAGGRNNVELPPVYGGTKGEFPPVYGGTEGGDLVAFTKEPSIIEQKAYRDTWGRGMDSYLQWFYETVILLRELLAEDGSLYVHLDWHVGHYAKCVLDEVFGYENFRNEIVWWYYDKFPTGGNVLDRQHDIIFQYTKSEKFVTNRITEPRVEPGRPTEVRKKVDGKITRIRDAETGKTTFIEGTTEKKISDVWRLTLINSMSNERLGYATQKPEALLERIIKASSNEGDLVLDCFCGSGTTAAVAEKLNRCWITCDLGRFAIHTARKRLLSIPNVKPFVVQNLGKYERQAWMGVEFEDQTTKLAQDQAYRQFILHLYHAEPLTGYAWLHGVKAGRMTHVGSVDAPVALGDVKQIVQEMWKTAGKRNDSVALQSDTGAQSSLCALTNGIDILGWEFAFELNETAKQFAAANNVDLKFKKIPREVLEKKAVEQGDIRFFELASLDVEVKPLASKIVSVTLTDFIVPPDDVPEDVRQSITHWTQWIDYWAIDWNYRNDTFHNEWQSYRTKQQPQLEIQTQHRYETAGQYAIVIKVIDILGNDTTKLIEVNIA